MERFDTLVTELDRWQDAGKTALFWWRDDDATTPTPELDRLAAVASGRPVSLAVIPRDADENLFRWIGTTSGFIAAQHGWSHQNHAKTGKKCEFSAERDPIKALSDVARGWARLSPLSERGRLDRLFVPPWNRIAPEIAGRIAEAGPTVVSLYGPRKPQESQNRLNTHLDPANWREGARFLGTAETLAPALRHLNAKRAGDDPNIDPNEPTGLLTHHLRHDPDSWDFITGFADVVSEHPAARWVSFRDAMGTPTSENAP